MSKSSKDSTSQKKRASKTSRNASDPFRNITIDQVAGNGHLSMHRVAASIYLDQLSLSEDQKSDMKKLYSKNQAIDLMYTKETQDDATAMLGVHDLHLSVSSNLSTRWTKQWQRDSGGKRAEATRRVLFQW